MKLRDKLLDEANIHSSYNLIFASILQRLEDILKEVESTGGEINIAMKQDVMKYSGQGNIVVKIMNLRGLLQKAISNTEEIMKASRKLK